MTATARPVPLNRTVARTLALVLRSCTNLAPTYCSLGFRYAVLCSVRIFQNEAARVVLILFPAIACSFVQRCSCWYPQPDLNRRPQAENLMSWAGLDDGDTYSARLRSSANIWENPACAR